VEAKNEDLDKQLVLVGGGHTHALLIRKLGQKPIPNVKTTLVSDAYHVPYSGTLPGYLAGIYRFDESHIDLYRLCTWAGVEFVHASVDGIDPKEKRISLKSFPSLAYDILSIDIGSTPSMKEVHGAEMFATGIKPVPQFLKVFDSLMANIESGKCSKQSIVIVGGGAAGVEVALGLRQRLALEHDIHLVHKNAEVLNDKPHFVRKKFQKVLVASGIKLHLGSPVERVEKNVLKLKNHQINYDVLFWMTQASAASWLKKSGLDLDQRGFLSVKDTLQTLAYDNVFATGDIASVKTEPRPKAGVFAVRQAEPLAENLRLVFAGGKARSFNPQMHFLAIVGTGDGKAVAMRGPFSASGAWAWRLKVRIDQKFMNQFETLPPVKRARSGEPKFEADVFDLPSLKSTEPVVPYTQKFSAFVDDPFLVGAIAANHCATDILLQGIVPKNLTLDLQTAPCSRLVLLNQLNRCLEGVRSRFEVFGIEPRHNVPSVSSCFAVRLSISGGKESRSQQKTCGIDKGDALIITKPLGTGLILTAAELLKAKGRWVEAALQTMMRNGTESLALAKRLRLSVIGHVAHTGLLGLLAGTLHEHANLGGKVTIRIDMASVPLVQGVRDCLLAGIESKATAKQVAMVCERVTVKPAKSTLELFPILFDPQIAGGLLFSVAANESLAVLKALHAQGDHSAAIIGHVEDPQDAQIIVG
jgi:selenide,water dikinase